VLTTLLGGVAFDRLLLAPERAAPAGIGGHIGPSRSPRGELGGLRVDAVAQVTLSAGSRGAVDSAAQSVIGTLLGARRSALVPVGIQGISLIDAGSPEPVAPAGVERRLSFRVRYEFQQAPQDAEGIIGQIPVNLRTIDPGEGAIIDADFVPGSLAWFEVVDDPRATLGGPSLWRYDPGQLRLEQRSPIRGGQNVPNANKPGTYLVLRATPDRPPVRDFTLQTLLRSEDNDGGIGLVFRYQDPLNFYLFLMDPAAGYRLLARKLRGSFSQLERGGLDTTASFPRNTDLELRLAVAGSDFEVFLDGQSILTGADTALVAPGRVGFMARRNERAYFRRIRVVPA
jgi:hypothetical protein